MWQSEPERWGAADFNIVVVPLAATNAFHEVAHGVVQLVKAMDILGQRLRGRLRITGLDPLPSHENPAAIADERVAVLAVAGRDQPRAVAVDVGHGEAGMAVVGIRLVGWGDLGGGHGDPPAQFRHTIRADRRVTRS